jgi:UDP-N-acetyl-D-mannosaminuronic acid dehydrogenase
MREEILVVGLGVIGLPTALSFFERGYPVIAYDKDVAKVAELSLGFYKSQCPKDMLGVYENSLCEFSSLPYVNQIEISKLNDITAVIVCVNADYKEEARGFDLSNVFSTFENVILPLLDIRKNKEGQKPLLISIESTLPIGGMKNQILSLLKDFEEVEDYILVYAPERITLERPMYNLQNMPRVLGLSFSLVWDKEVFAGIEDRVINLYKGNCSWQCSFVSWETAEIVKLAENAHRYVNIAFANQIAEICDMQDVNYNDVMRCVNSLPNVEGNERINPVRNLMYAGVGVGGYCLEKDTRALSSFFESSDATCKQSLLRASLYFNACKVRQCVGERVIDCLNGYRNLEKVVRVLFLGATGIPNTGDSRNSYTYGLMRDLNSVCVISSLRVTFDYFDPYINPAQGDKTNLEEFDVAMKGVDVLILSVPHNIFKCWLDPSFYYELEGRRVLDLNKWKGKVIREEEGK